MNSFKIKLKNLVTKQPESSKIISLPYICSENVIWIFAFPVNCVILHFNTRLGKKTKISNMHCSTNTLFSTSL